MGTIHYGVPIPVFGKKPDWLNDNDRFKVRYYDSFEDVGPTTQGNKEEVFWSKVESIRLLSDHILYLPSTGLPRSTP